jgi:8-oxo-dGTP diphosphatase
VNFEGAKLAVLVRGRVLVMLRDDRPDIPFPAHWDLPGGGREGGETPEACVLRETEEELGLRFDAVRLGWRRRFPPQPGQPGPTWLFVLRDDALDPARIALGAEGQAGRLMPVAEFLGHARAVPHLAGRLAAYLAEAAG